MAASFENVAHESFRARQRQNQVFGFLLQPFVLIRDGEVHSRRVQPLRNGPRDRALVRHSKDDRRAALQLLKHENLSRKEEKEYQQDQAKNNLYPDVERQMDEKKRAFIVRFPQPASLKALTG